MIDTLHLRPRLQHRTGPGHYTLRPRGHVISSRKLHDTALGALFEDLKHPPPHHVGGDSAELEALARQVARGGATRIYAVGGDGTLNAIVNGIADLRDPPQLVVVPAGTANDFAAGIGISGTAVEAVEAVWRGKTLPVPTDVVRVNGRACLNVLSIGGPAEVTRSTPQVLKETLGGVAYLAYGIATTRALEDFAVTIEGDGLTFPGRALAVYVGNAPLAGGGFRVCPDADPTDGVFDLLLVPTMDSAEVLALMADTAFLGDPRRNEFVEHLRLSQATIDIPCDLPVNLDGEPLDHQGRLEIRLDPGALLVHHPMNPSEAP